jgi:ubiquinone/menaquinone biosynthesis C-methylase UbiE
MNYRDRVKREQEQFNKGVIRRDHLNKLLSHSIKLLDIQLLNDVKKYMSNINDKMCLEIGALGWKTWIDDIGIRPRELHCINISESELELGLTLAKGGRMKPIFHLMDAHELKFQDESFDLIFGVSVLHHLDINKAVSEFYRVLKPKGIIIFAEPLDINPFSKMIRYFTPKARTIDEQALRFIDLRTIGNNFNLELISYQLFTVPLSCISVFLFNTEINPIMKLAAFLDNNLKRIVPFFKYYYRYALIYGCKRKGLK